MATIREFAEAVAAKINGATVREVEKANGITHIGITVDQGTISPTVYLEQMYEDDMSVEQAAAAVLRIAEENRVKSSDVVRDFTDYEGFVKQNLRARLYNKKTTAEVKRSAASRGFKDLIIVPVVEMSVINGMSGVVKVLKDHIEKWGVTEKEVIDQAIKNSAQDVVVEDLFELAAKMTGMPVEIIEATSNGPREIVVSTSNKAFGAAAILGKIKEFKERFTNGFYVLPSSVHEVIVVPAKGDPDEQEILNAMVADVNRTTVVPEEVLSDKAYYFA